MDKDPKSPATTSLAYDKMAPAWEKIQTVLDGTEAMRAAGTRYLPQHKYEPDEVYNERLQRSTLLNMTKLTLGSWVGRPFSDPIAFDKVPKLIEDLLTDVDLVGTDVQVFARDWFSDGLAKAFSFVYVDYPRTDDTEGVRTLAMDREEKVRPYWIHIRPEQLFFAEAKMVQGKEVLTEIRIMEEVIERDDFAEKCIQQIRRVFMDAQGVGNVELYQLQKVKGKEKWVKIKNYTFSLPFIPLVVFYSHREAFMSGTPPLEDLADLNIAHWQSSADQRACLTVARFPILSLTGGTDAEGTLKIGPNRWLHSTDPQARFAYVEHSGAAIGVGRHDLLDLQEQMGEYGAEFLRKRPGNVTATARALDSAEATSPLQDAIIRFGCALTLALEYTAKWMNLPEGGTATLSTEFGPETSDQAELNTLSATRAARDISRKAYLEELKRRGLLADEYDIDEDAKLLEQEALDLFGSAVPVLPPPPAKADEQKTDDGQPPPDENQPPPQGK